MATSREIFCETFSPWFVNIPRKFPATALTNWLTDIALHDKGQPFYKNPTIIRTEKRRKKNRKDFINWSTKHATKKTVITEREGQIKGNWAWQTWLWLWLRLPPCTQCQPTRCSKMVVRAHMSHTAPPLASVIQKQDRHILDASSSLFPVQVGPRTDWDWPSYSAQLSELSVANYT